MLPSVTSVEVTGPHRLRLRFNDGVEGEIDFATILQFDGVFEPLRDADYFARVRVDDEAGTICWPNGVDLDPLVLHSRVTNVPIRFDTH